MTMPDRWRAIAQPGRVVVLHRPGEQRAPLDPERRQAGAAPLLEPLDQADQHGVLGPGALVAQPRTASTSSGLAARSSMSSAGW